MDFELNEEQKLWRNAVREFAQKEIAPRVREIDTTERIPREIIQGMGRLGLLAPVTSEEYGGAGMDWTMAAIAARNWAEPTSAWRCGSVPGGSGLGIHL